MMFGTPIGGRGNDGWTDTVEDGESLGMFRAIGASGRRGGQAEDLGSGGGICAFKALPENKASEMMREAVEETGETGRKERAREGRSGGKWNKIRLKVGDIQFFRE